jgi:hypothetical protein
MKRLTHKTDFGRTVRRIARTVAITLLLLPSITEAENRSFDGSGNNVEHPQWGVVGTQFIRVAPPAYGDGISTPSGADRPRAREVSNAVGNQTARAPNARNLSGYVYAFGQFLNHEVERSYESAEAMNISTSTADPYFLGADIPMNRSAFDASTGLGPDNPRQQTNSNTSYIDASTVYGADQNRADSLRERSPNGLGARLLTSETENLLPRNSTIQVEMEPVGFPDPALLFVAGESRANENAGLASLHTVFMREHNRLVDGFTRAHPTWSSEEIYQRARKTVGAKIQAITYNEFLPALLGPHAPGSDALYDPSVDASIINEFATVFLRIGHSMLPSEFRRIQNDGLPGPGDHVGIFATAFDVSKLLGSSLELELHLKGLSIEPQEEVDTLVTDDSRNFVAASFDIMSVDIQRARDRGMPDYDAMRRAYGLPPVTSFAEITSDPQLQLALEQLYGDVNRVDPLIGTLAEDHLPGASVGPLAAAGLTEQFVRLRKGDRFWFENDSEFTAEELAALRATRLSDIIRTNTTITNLQDNVFFIPELGDFNGSGQLDVSDIDLLARDIQTQANLAMFDVNRDGSVNGQDRRLWVDELAHTYVGDANLDGVFNNSDFVQIFQGGFYETGQDAGWGSGDWDGDGRFTSGDFVMAFQDGGYEKGPRTALVPEPTGLLILGMALLGFGRRRE